jgi:hypothetical protein
MLFAVKVYRHMDLLILQGSLKSVSYSIYSGTGRIRM